eukprot:CAMPEP_0172014972 /NCGR_PEP_ID=MMETSP1041-20130122/10226_1 /TAXON_ID=464988 /ORGANISM="Hemiselmis andersenii, Strain CCMP439" /LENGTH=209 /DNA_ID=CAMNT_0012669791 /DNA_START=148 /DNA_END=774 /DNA_ORIENTATION=+
MKKSPLVVGLCGPSGSGKSTQSDALAEELGGTAGLSATVLHADHYFHHPGPPPPYKERGDMEGPETVDWDRLAKDIDACTEKASQGEERTTAVVIVEGFLLLWCDEVVKRCGVLVFLRAGKEECLARRLGRNPERSQEERKDLAAYFERCVWPAYTRYIEPVANRLAAEEERKDLAAYFERCVWPAYTRYIEPVANRLAAEEERKDLAA